MDPLQRRSNACLQTSMMLIFQNKIKCIKNRRYIENLRKYPEIGKKLLEKYS